MTDRVSVVIVQYSNALQATTDTMRNIQKSTLIEGIRVINLKFEDSNYTL